MLVNKLVPCAWLFSGALEIWRLRLRKETDCHYSTDTGKCYVGIVGLMLCNVNLRKLLSAHKGHVTMMSGGQLIHRRYTKSSPQ